jgi:hypothetical protein
MHDHFSKKVHIKEQNTDILFIYLLFIYLFSYSFLCLCVCSSSICSFALNLQILREVFLSSMDAEERETNAGEDIGT